MKLALKLLGYFLTIIIIYACNQPSAKVPSELSNTFKTSLIEKQIDSSGYYISLPPGYAIRVSEGPDFEVYYFSSIDTTGNHFSGGMYFGNYPSEFVAPSDSCNIEKMNGEILGSQGDWTIYNCAGRYSIQTITNSKSGERWNNKIHAFGDGSSKDELEKILDVYSTLKIKK